MCDFTATASALRCRPARSRSMSALRRGSMWLRQHPHVAATRTSKVKSPGSQKRRSALRTGAFGTDSLDGRVLRVDGRKGHRSRRPRRLDLLGILIVSLRFSDYWTVVVVTSQRSGICRSRGTRSWRQGGSVASCGSCAAIAHHVTSAHELGSASTTGFTCATGFSLDVSPVVFGCSWLNCVRHSEQR